MESVKIVLMNPTCRAAKETDIKNKILDTVGEGEGGMIRKNSIETYILAYAK